MSWRFGDAAMRVLRIEVAGDSLDRFSETVVWIDLEVPTFWYQLILIMVIFRSGDLSTCFDKLTNAPNYPPPSESPRY